MIMKRVRMMIIKRIIIKVKIIIIKVKRMIEMKVKNKMYYCDSGASEYNPRSC